MVRGRRQENPQAAIKVSEAAKEVALFKSIKTLQRAAAKESAFSHLDVVTCVLSGKKRRWSELIGTTLGLAHSLLLPAPEIGRGSAHFLDFEIIVIDAAQISVQTLERRPVCSWSLFLAAFTPILAFAGSEVA